jgi:hypothetical protein
MCVRGKGKKVIDEIKEEEEYGEGEIWKKTIRSNVKKD